MKISQRHLARQLKVSVATISRCLRQDPTIPAETRARVMSFASKSGYRLKTRTRDYLMNTAGEPGADAAESLVLAVFAQVEDIGANETAHQAIAGMSQAAHDLKATLVLHAIPLPKKGSIHVRENQPELMQKGKVQGVVLLYHFAEESVLQLAKQTTCVSIAHYHPQVHMDCVGADNGQEFLRIVEHLVGLGHRKIGYVDDFISTSFYDERFGGYMVGLTKAGLAFHPEWALRGTKDVRTDLRLLDGLETWLRQGVTAVVCANDAVAVSVYRWVKSHGYKCPEQLSITGFDGMVLPPDIPPLTTVRLHFHDFGRLAVERLIGRLREPTLPSVRMMVEGAFVTGKTSGPCPSE